MVHLESKAEGWRKSAAKQAMASLAAAAVLASAGSLLADPPGTIVARVTGLRSNAGQIGCTLYNSANGFPGNAAAALQRRWCPIDKGGSRCAFEPVPAGVYAVACLHDENSNGKIDTGFLGIPKEGIVVSNNAKGFMGPPSFKDAAFSFSGASRELTLKMAYF
jgi:uncharacterized protein (DUF2141 family)